MHCWRLAGPSMVAGIAAVIGLAGPAPAGSPTITILVQEGDEVPEVGFVTSIDNLAVNKSGDWIVESDTNHADTNADSVLLKNGPLYLREGQALAAPEGASIGSFDAITLNINADSGWNFFLDGTSGGSDDSGVFFNAELVLQESTVSGAAGFSDGTVYIGFFEVKISDSGHLLVLASVDDPAVPSSVDRALVIMEPGDPLVETVVAKEGDILPGQTEPVADFQTGPHDLAFNNGGQAMFIADLAGDTSTDGVVYVGKAIVAQEGSPSPVTGRNWQSLSSAVVDLNDLSGWALRGLLDGDTATNTVIVANGAAVIQEGDTLPAIAGFNFTGFGSGAPVQIDAAGNVVWFGDWDDPDTSRDTGLFRNDQLLVQEGVTTVEGLLVQSIGSGVQDLFDLSDNGRFIVLEVTLTGGINAALLIDVGPDTCLGDTDGNGEVDVDDLTNVILDWGNCCTFGGDADGDGDVDVDDLTLVILAWGPCP